VTNTTLKTARVGMSQVGYLNKKKVKHIRNTSSCVAMCLE